MTRKVIQSDRTKENIDYHKAFINVYDSTNHILRMIATLRDSSGVKINPATEEKQNNIITELQSFNKNGENTLIFLDHDINAVRNGIVYTMFEISDIANGESRDILFTTPDNEVRAHLRYNIETEAEATFSLFEDSIVSDNGTAKSIFNRLRESIDTSEMLIFHTPTITGDGNQIKGAKTGEGKAAGGKFIGMSETTLKPNTKYIFRITNDTTSLNWCSIRLNWYEK